MPPSNFNAVAMSRAVADFACTICGCVCDDLRVTVDGETIVQAEGACRLARPRLVGLARIEGPASFMAGGEAEYAVALNRAAELLSAAKAPLIYGLSGSSTEGQRAACELADWLGGTIDTTASLGHGRSMVALQQVGESTCTLGEVRHRSDLVIYWGSNPVVTHPRHLERYSVDAIGRFAGRRTEKTLVVVDIRPTETAQRADMFLQVEPETDFDLLWALRCLVRDVPIADSWTPPPGLSGRAIIHLAERMKSCRSGVVFFGSGLTRHTGGHATVAALLQLVTELNAHTRFYAMGMDSDAAATGAENMLAWQTGFPLGVNFARGFPRYGPGEFTATELLERGEVDACLVVGGDSLKSLPSAALQRLQEIPTILLDPAEAELEWQPTVRFRTARVGIDLPGTAYRMDQVPIPLRPVLGSDAPSDGQTLAAILDLLKSHRPK